MTDFMSYLREHVYPGRGILLGRSSDNSKAVIAYFIMGRSVNSRNRVFEETDDGIRTKPCDESKMSDPSLVIYHPIRKMENGVTIIANGDQTDTICNFIAEGKTFADALRTRTFEPDGPNWTPRISGIVNPDGSYSLSILKTLDGDNSCSCRYFYEYSAPKAGTGHFISTYVGFGEPTPSFQGEPMTVSIEAADVKTLTDSIWINLNADNKISLFVSYIDLSSGESESAIINKYE